MDTVLVSLVKARPFHFESSMAHFSDLVVIVPITIYPLYLLYKDLHADKCKWDDVIKMLQRYDV